MKIYDFTVKDMDNKDAVSYTHLDVYKRQVWYWYWFIWGQHSALCIPHYPM